VLSLQDVKLVIKGAGAASIARIELLKAMGLAHENAIIAIGRSDYSNQVNNVLGFPYIFRSALDVRATINDAMKIAPAYAIAALAREDVPG
jgi:malic enzyme